MNAYIRKYINESAETLKKIDEKELESTIDIIKEAKENNKTVYICGNGGSAGTAIHMAADLFGMSGMKSISLCDNVPLMTAIINDFGWDKLYLNQLERFYTKGDVLVVISVHGGTGEDEAGVWSQNLVRAIKYVQAKGGKVIGLAGFDGGLFKKLCNASVIIPANSTPVVESLHVVISHLMAFSLQKGNRK